MGLCLRIEAVVNIHKWSYPPTDRGGVPVWLLVLEFNPYTGPDMEWPVVGMDVGPLSIVEEMILPVASLGLLACTRILYCTSKYEVSTKVCCPST